MLKALIKKEFLQLGFSLSKSGRRKKGLGAGTKAVLIFAALYVGGVLGFMFYNLADILGGLLVPAGMGDMFFAMMGLVAAALGLIGSVLTTYSTIYQNNDNELLLSMPIPPAYITAVKMLICYFMTLLFELFVFVPAYIVYFTLAKPTFGAIVIAVINLVIHPLLALALACVLSFVIAFVVSRTPANLKTGVTVFFTLAFIGAYFLFYTKAMEMFTEIGDFADDIVSFTRSYMHLFVKQGEGCTGNGLSYLIFAAIVIALFGVIYYLISKTFIGLATVKKGTVTVKKKFKRVALKNSGADKALFFKEFSRLKASAGYIMNGALGTIMMLVLIVVMIVFSSKLEQIKLALAEFGVTSGEYMLLLGLASGFILTMNQLSTASVSMEGKNLWLIRSLPVDTQKVLKTKLHLHTAFTAPPVVILNLIAGIMLDMGIKEIVLLAVMMAVITDMFASIGLMLNLKHPNLDWTNEMSAVKNSIAMLIAIFGEWGIVIVLAVCYIFIPLSIDPFVFGLIVTVLCGALTALLRKRIMTKGVELFEKL